MTQPDSTNKNYELSCTLREVIKKASKYRDSASTKENICIILDDNNKGTTSYFNGRLGFMIESLIRAACKIFENSESQGFIETVYDERMDTESACTGLLNDIISVIIDAYADTYKETF